MEGVILEGLQLIEEAVGLALVLSGPTVLGALVVLEDVLEFLLAFLGTPMIPKLAQLPVKTTVTE